MLFQSVADSILAMITIENKCSAWIKTERKQIVMGNHKDTGKTEDYSFQVDLRGIIRLLSENLYSSEDVFLRELLQNAVDAIEARKAAEPDFEAGRIRISYRRETKTRARLIFADNGIGLTREEIHTFLSVIGQSSKRGALERGNFIGQFGIGLLSCFLVADEILVRSRSLKEEAGHRWLGKSDGTYQVAKEPEEVSVGTEVILLLKGKMAARYHEEEVIRLLKEYGFLLKTPVEFDGDGGTRRINDGFIPWRQPFCSNEEILRFGELLFEEEFFGAVPIKGEGLTGYAFISRKRTNAAFMGQHKIFLKDMLITEDGRELIPKWAFFTRCILNAEDLTPMASREGFVADYRLSRARNDIEKSIFEYFVALSLYDVNMLKQLTSVHNVAIKSLAVENEKIYKLFFQFLVFSSNRGSLTGFQLLEAAKRGTIYYCTEVEDYRRAYALLGNGAGILINAGYIYDTKLLQLLRRYHPGIRLEVFDEASYGELLEEPEESVRKDLEELLKAAGEALKPFNCKAVLKQFDPPESAAFYVPGEDGLFDGVLTEGSFSDFLGEFDPGNFVRAEDNYGTKLYLNGKNPLLRRLSQVRDAEITRTMIEVIYVHAMLAGHYTLGEKEMGILNRGLIRLVEYGLGDFT